MRKFNKAVAVGLAGALAATMVLTGCSGGNAGSTSGTTESGAASSTGESSGEIEKPEKITIMVNGTFTTQANARDQVEKAYEEATGIDLEIIQPDHNAYFDVLGQTFASGVDNWPDVIMTGSSNYASYAMEGALWDMTEAWENSELKASGRMAEDVVEGMYIDGHLYGFPYQRGNGCVTYVKKAWLDNVGMEAPTNYEEYTAMLDAFTKGDPDGNGVNGDTYGVSAAGLINPEAPYTLYLPEFYQGATPSFEKDENGVWYDGFTQDNFKEALTRLREAYVNGWLEKETLTNGTNDCRNKFFEDKFGVFTYWAGTWASRLKDSLEANGLDGELIALEPIQEVGTYIERAPSMWAITNACENPEGVFKYFIEAMMDGGELQTLFTYGVEGTHWSTEAGTVCGNTYADGEFHQLESLETPGMQYTKQTIDPMLSIAEWDDPGMESLAEEVKTSQQMFNDNCHQETLVVSNDAMATYNGDLMTLKSSIIADVVVKGVSIEEAYQRFEDEGGANWSQMIVDELNKA